MFHAVHAVPKQIGVMGFERTRSKRIAAQDFPDFGVIGHAGNSRAIPQARAGEARHVFLGGQAIDFQYIGQSAGNRLVDKQRFARGDYRPGLLQMLASVDTFQQDDVNAFEESGDRVDNFDSRLPQPLGEHPNAIDAVRNVLAAAGKRGDHPALPSKSLLPKKSEVCPENRAAIQGNAAVGRVGIMGAKGSEKSTIVVTIFRFRRWRRASGPTV